LERRIKGSWTERPLGSVGRKKGRVLQKGRNSQESSLHGIDEACEGGEGGKSREGNLKKKNRNSVGSEGC